MKKYLFTILLLVLLAFPVFATNTYTTDLESGSSQFWSITDANQTGLDLTGDFTIEMWVNFESITGSDRTLFAKFEGTTGRAYEAQMKSGGTSIEMVISPNGTNTSQTGVIFSWTPNLATWYHIAIVYDASEGSAQLFVNGSQQDTTKTGLATSIGNVSTTFRLGTLWGTGGYFDGLMDDVRVWNITKTETEIANNYNCSLTGTETGLVAYWRFDNNGTDSTSNANNLTNNNSATFQSASLPFTNTCGGSVAPTSAKKRPPLIIF